MEFSQELAQKMLSEGAICFCLGLPEGSEFGIDLKSFNTGEKFCGMKMIPPGFHFVYYSIENDHGDQSPRVGFLHNFRSREILVRKWDAIEEEFVDEQNTEVVERLKANVKNMDRFLGPYPYEIWEKWKNLTNNVSETLVDKVIPLCGKINSVLELKATNTEQPETDENMKAKNFKKRRMKLFLCDEKTEDFLPNLEPTEGTDFRFSKIPDQWYPENATPSEITKHSLDSSYLFEQLLIQHEKPADILGEIQLSFVAFLIGYSFEAFEHWKKLISVFCSCDEAILKNIEVFSGFITVLNYQLQEIQEDFLVDIVAGNNIVYKNLRIFFRNLQSSEANGRLKAKGKRCQELLTEKLLWDFSDILEEVEEDLPVVVQT